ncbi:MAG: site-specific DNA-methyltransferase, partial [Oscillospiraceae bacterium]
MDFEKTENLYIEGDNLDALKLLQETYLGKVKMIYIDPPYNTGNDFVYEDDFAESAEDYMDRSGDYDEEGNRLFKNTDSNGRFHTDWLNMLYPRLKLAKDLLSDDGVIFISIDDNEVENLKKCCDEIFGIQNYEALITWRRRHNQPNDKSKMIAKVAENIVVFSKNSLVLTERKAYHGFPFSDDRIAEYRNPDNDPNGRWTSNPWKAAIGRGGTRYTITTPNGVTFTETWYGNEKTFSELLKAGKVHWTDGGNGFPRIKIYLKEAEKEGQAAINFFTHEKFGSNQEGSAELESLFAKKGIFDNPKPIKLLKSLLMLSSNDDSIILDFFSGSATTAHAVMQLNAEDGGHRKFIMVQLPEETDEKSEAYKAGYKNICEIGKERIRRAGQKIKEEAGLPVPNLDIGFRVLKVDSTNMEDVYYNPTEIQQGNLFFLADNIKPDRTAEDLLFQIMLDLGLLLSGKIEQTEIAGKTLYSVEGGHLLACFDSGVTDEVITAVAKQKPY